MVFTGEHIVEQTGAVFTMRNKNKGSRNLNYLILIILSSTVHLSLTMSRQQCPIHIILCRIVLLQIYLGCNSKLLRAHLNIVLTGITSFSSAGYIWCSLAI